MFKKKKVFKGQKRQRSPDSQQSSDEDVHQQSKRTENESVIRIQRPSANALVSASTTATASSSNRTASSGVSVAYESSGTAAPLISATDLATSQSQIDTEFDRDHRALLEKKIMSMNDAGALEDGDSSSYKGIHGYQEFLGSGAVGSRIRVGPLRASQNIRVTSRFDYQPDICKDYKETGYCGYGDSCKFLHDRGDYKSGWEIDKEWEKEMKAKKEEELRKRDFEVFLEKESDDEDEDEDEDDVQWACLICRMPFRDPVVTKCGHHFCSQCAIKHHRKSPKCFQCGQPTLGSFAVAKELKAKLKKREERLKKKLEKVNARNTAGLEGGELEDIEASAQDDPEEQ